MNKNDLYKNVKSLFHPTASKNIDKYLEIVIKSLYKYNIDYKKMVSMALSTIAAETGRFEPISEYISKYNTSPGGHPFDLYDNKQSLGNKGYPDGSRFKGRGFIQLTGRYNYTYYGKKLGVNLVSDPDKACDPKIAADLLSLFLKNKEDLILNALNNNDLKKARRLVNGGYHGLTVFSKVYNKSIKILPDKDSYYEEFFKTDINRPKEQRIQCKSSCISRNSIDFHSTDNNFNINKQLSSRLGSETNNRNTRNSRSSIWSIFIQFIKQIIRK